MAEGVHKLTFRLDESNPREKAAWEKLKNSGIKQQQFLLEAVEAYRSNPLGSLPMDDIDKIANRIIWRMEQIGISITTEDQETISEEAEPVNDQRTDTDFEDEEEEISESMGDVLSFLEKL